MPKTVDKEKFLSKIPVEFKGLVRSEADFAYVSAIWKLEPSILKSLLPSVPEKLKPLFDWKLSDKPKGKRGNRSNLPYETKTIKLTTDLMKLSPGAVVSVEGGLAGSLLTVQVLVKLDVNGKTKTVSVSNIEGIQADK